MPLPGRRSCPSSTGLPTCWSCARVSKLGLAGLRLGLLAGARQWLDQLDKVRLPYNVNVLTQCVAEKVLEHADVLEAQAAAIRAERGRLAAALAARPGVTAFHSAANFILFRVPGAPRVFEGAQGAAGADQESRRARTRCSRTACA